MRGNGKIIQELEGEFRGSGWNVIKLIWGSNWEPLLARDKSGKLRQLMMEMLDGDYKPTKPMMALLYANTSSTATPKPPNW